MMRWIAFLVVLAGALAAACGGGDGTPSAPPTLVVPDALRWGFNPLRPTGLTDPPLARSPLPPGYRIETVATGLVRPTQVASMPDGRLLVTEQTGAVRVVEDGRLADEPFAVIDVFLPEDVLELGLVGLAVDPDFERNRYVYVSYNADGPRRTAIARIRDDAGRGTSVEEIFAWEAAPECCHIGGGMRFAPDGTLMMGMGDHYAQAAAQDPSTPPGSILRLNRDGSFPDDNPFGGPVYAYGLRNPYDIAIDSETGRMFAGDDGRWGQDAVVEVKSGANYGWPGRGLRVPQSEIEPPLTFYHNLGGIAGMEFYSHEALEEFTDSLFYCRFTGATLHRLDVPVGGPVREEIIESATCSTDVTTGPDGSLLFLDYVEGVLYRIAGDGE